MSWPACLTIVIAVTISFVIYFSDNNICFTYRKMPPLYHPLDAGVCVIFGIYFLVLSIGTWSENCSLERSDVQKGGIFYLLLDIIILSLLCVRNISPVQAFGVQKLHISQLIRVSMLGLATLYPLIFSVQIVSEKLQGIHSNQPLVQFLMQNTSCSDRTTVTLLAVVIAPLSEELIFRGYLYGVLRQYIGVLGSTLVTSTLFAGIHQYIAIFPGLFLLAVGLSCFYERTGCLLVPILMHSLFNFVGIMAIIC